MIQYAENFRWRVDPPPSTRRGCFPYGMNSSGYGRKIASQYKVQLAGEKIWRRVFVTCYSNCASLWIEVRGEKFHFHETAFMGTQRSQQS